MNIKAVLFDLDGTLLPMDQGAFIRSYFGLLATKLAPLGYKPEELVKAIWEGTAAMVSNAGGKTNEEVFWDCFTRRYGEGVRKDIPVFDEFYRTDFAGARKACGFAPQATQVIARVKEKGLRPVLATNPIFPAVATQNRIAWAGLTPEDFEMYTTYENSCHCKPNPDYYREILAKLGLRAEECAMVGNDVTEDMVAATLGMKVFLLTDCIINKNNEDISVYPNGNFEDLLNFIEIL